MTSYPITILFTTPTLFCNDEPKTKLYHGILSRDSISISKRRLLFMTHYHFIPLIFAAITCIILILDKADKHSDHCILEKKTSGEYAVFQSWLKQ